MKKLSEAQKQKIDDKFSTFQKWAGRLGAIATVIGVVTAGGAWIINQVNDNIATKLENQTAEIQKTLDEINKKLDAQKDERTNQVEIELIELIDELRDKR